MADHRVDDEEHFVGLSCLTDVGGLAHQLLVDTEATGGVDEHDVVVVIAGLGDACARDGDGIAVADRAQIARLADAGPGIGREHRDTRALADDLQLRNGTWPLEVAGDEQRSVTLLLEPVAELAREGGLTRALQAREHDDGRRALGELHAARLAAEDADELLVDYLDDLLGGVERLRDLGALGALLDPGDEGAHHGKRDVGLEEGKTDLTCGAVDVGVGQASLAAQILQRTGQAIGEGVEHCSSVP